LSLEHLLANKPSDSFNLGTGKGYSVKEIIQAVEKASKKTIPVITEAKRAGDPAILVANADKAKKILKWQATYTDINEIVTTAYNWHAQRLINTP
jgi:UDP-glucose 4-epimerase